MHVKIEFNAVAFDEDEILNVISQLADKVLEQSLVLAECTDEDYEDMYVLRAIDNSVCGTIQVMDEGYSDWDDDDFDLDIDPYADDGIDPYG